MRIKLKCRLKIIEESRFDYSFEYSMLMKKALTVAFEAVASGIIIGRAKKCQFSFVGLFQEFGGQRSHARLAARRGLQNHA